jgi:uracil-DNA glycosylase family 4
MKNSPDTLQVVTDDIVHCERCPRLRRYGEEIARVKRRAYRSENYWGKPVPGFGDPHARLLIVGLAPGAHGANRTGRMFTGDRSGDFLYRALFENGFATQPESRAIGDGLELKDAYLTGAVRCAPPDNKPLPEEFERCRSYLERELDLLTGVRVVVVLGKLAADAYLGILRGRGVIRSRAQFPFGHGNEFAIGADHRDVKNMDVKKVDAKHPVLLCSYHPSQQNTSTGKLTAEMLREIFARARAII